MWGHTTSQTEPITTHASVDIYVNLYNETKSEFVIYSYNKLYLIWCILKIKN